MLDDGEVDFAILLMLEEMLRVDHVSANYEYARKVFSKDPVFLALVEEGILYKNKHHAVLTFSSRVFA